MLLRWEFIEGNMLIVWKYCGIKTIMGKVSH